MAWPSRGEKGWSGGVWGGANLCTAWGHRNHSHPGHTEASPAIKAHKEEEPHRMSPFHRLVLCIARSMAGFFFLESLHGTHWVGGGGFFSRAAGYGASPNQRATSHPKKLRASSSAIDLDCSALVASLFFFFLGRVSPQVGVCVCGARSRTLAPSPKPFPVGFTPGC